jgi:hypothetical protein
VVVSSTDASCHETPIVNNPSNQTVVWGVGVFT